jgi:hypothetical protein
MKKTIFGLLGIAFIVFACEKKDTIPNRTTLNPANSANIKAMHLSPDAPLFNLMVDSIRALTVLETAADVESGIGFGTVVPSLSNGYSIVPGGAHTISAKVPWTSTTTPGQTILTKQATLDAGKYYTIAVVDSLSRLDAVIIEDNLNVPDTSKSYFRILNFMMKGTADLEFQGSSGGYNFNKNGITFKTVTNFDTLTQGTYKIILRANGAATRLDSITAFTPLKGRKYTLYTRGVVGQTGSTNTKRPLLFSIQNL